jgi:hypothetical protein
MTRAELFDSLTRWVFPAFTFYGDAAAKEKEKLDYSNTIYGLCSTINGLHFDECAKHLMRNWKASPKPKPGHFYSSYRYLADMKGWGQREVRKCSTCNETGFVYVWVKNEEGRDLRAMIGCGTCNERMANLKPGLVLTEPPPGSTVRVEDIKLNPAHAKILFRIAEDAGFRLSDAMWERLTFFASQEDRCLEVLEREAQSRGPEFPQQYAEKGTVATDKMLEAHYANLPMPGAPVKPPAPPPAPIAKEPEPEPIQSAPPADMPF